MNKKIESRKKKYLEMQKKYRLENPFYNWIHSYEPKVFGFVFGFFAGCVWTVVLPVDMNLYISVLTILSGVLAWFLAKLSHKEFDKEKKIQGFRDDEWYLD